VRVRRTSSGLEGVAVGRYGFISRYKSGSWFVIAGTPYADGGAAVLPVVDSTPLPDGGWFVVDLDGRTREWNGAALVAGTALPTREYFAQRPDFGGVYGHAFTVADQVHVVSDPGQLFRVGGAGWEEVRLTTARKHTASFVRTPSDAWLAGDGSLQHFDGRRWEERIRNVTDATLYDIDVTAQTGFAVGEGGLVLRRQGASWTRVNIGTSVDLTGVVAFDCDFAIVVGARGTIAMWDGLSWRLVPSGVTDDLFGLFALSRTEVWAVGANGTILKFDGTRWTRDQVPTTRNLAAVWGPDRTHLWAVGANGVVLTYDGTRWALDQFVGSSMTFTDVHGTSSNRVFVAGTQGVRLWDGTTWRSVSTTGATSVLATDTTFLVAAGGVSRSGSIGFTTELGIGTFRLIKAHGRLWAAGPRGSILSKIVDP
jgi:hypothetical protein